MKEALLFLIPAVSFLYYPLAYEQFETPKAYALLTFACFSMPFVDWKMLLKDKVAQCLCLFILSALMSTIFSGEWYISVFGNTRAPMGLLVILSFLPVYLASKQVFQSKEALNQVIDMLIVCAVVVSIYAICQACGIDFKTWNKTLKDANYTRPMSTLGHPNFTANYLAMVLPFALFRLDRALGLNRKIAYACAASLLYSAIFLSLSRGMIIAALAGSIIYFIMAKKRLKQVAGFFVALIGLVIVAYFTVPKFKVDAGLRMQALVSPGLARKEYPKGAINIWKKAPIFGTGVETFEIVFRNQRSERYWKAEPGGSPHKAHNDFLNVLATQGLFGAISVILLTIAIIIRAKRATSQVSAAAIASIVVFYVAGLTSFTIVSTGVLFMLCASLLKEDDIK